MPHVQGFYILHEGLIGVVDDGGLEEISYTQALENPPAIFKSKTRLARHHRQILGDRASCPEQGQAFEAQIRRHAG